MVEPIGYELFLITGILLFGISFYGLLIEKHIMRKVLAVNLMGSGVFLIFGVTANIFGESQTDPVPQAIVITGIVVAISATAFALVIAMKLQALSGGMSLEEKEKP